MNPPQISIKNQYNDLFIIQVQLLLDYFIESKVTININKIMTLQDLIFGQMKAMTQELQSLERRMRKSVVLSVMIQ